MSSAQMPVDCLRASQMVTLWYDMLWQSQVSIVTHYIRHFKNTTKLFFY